MKRFWKLSLLVTLVVVVAIFGFTACDADVTSYNVELIKNGSFETWSDSKGSIDDWTKKTISGSVSGKVGRFQLADDNKPENAGTYGLEISNDKNSATCFSQSVKVDRNATYKVSLVYKLDSPVGGNTGADAQPVGPHLAFYEDVNTIVGNEFKNANGEWNKVELYVTPRNTDYLTLSLMLGGSGREVSGTVYFDTVSMMRVDSVPVGETIHQVKANRLNYNITASGIAFVVLLALLSIAILVCAYIFIRRIYSKKNAFDNIDSTNESKSAKSLDSNSKIKKVLTHPIAIASYLGLGTFLLRLIVVLTTFGFGSQTNVLAAASETLALNGVKSAYASLTSTTSLMGPGSIYILYIIGAMGQNLARTDISILIRMVSVLADIATVLMIYFYGKKYVGNKLSTVYATLYAVLPISFLISGMRGSFDSVLIALILGAFLLALEKKFLSTYLLSTLAILLDIRALAVVPLILVYMGYMYYRSDVTMKTFGTARAKIVFGFVAMLVGFYVLALPVTLGQIQSGSPFFILTRYKDMIANAQLYVSNAFNLYGMVGMNFKLVNKTASILNLIFILVLVIYVSSLYFKNRNRAEMLLLASYMFAMVAVFTLKVTETYLVLSLALMLVYVMLSGEKRMYGVFASYSVLAFLCIGQLISQSNFLSSSTSANLVNFETLSVYYIFFSIVTVLVTLYYSYVVYTICNNAKIVDIKAMPQNFIITAKNWFDSLSMRLKKQTKNKQIKNEESQEK